MSAVNLTMNEQVAMHSRNESKPSSMVDLLLSFVVNYEITLIDNPEFSNKESALAQSQVETLKYSLESHRQPESAGHLVVAHSPTLTQKEFAEFASSIRNLPMHPANVAHKVSWLSSTFVSKQYFDNRLQDHDGDYAATDLRRMFALTPLYLFLVAGVSAEHNDSRVLYVELESRFAKTLGGLGFNPIRIGAASDISETTGHAPYLVKLEVFQDGSHPLAQLIENIRHKMKLFKR